jgi:hypothetical protein
MDDAGDLVAEGDRGVAGVGGAVEEMEIGPAHPAGFDSDDDLAGRRFGLGHLLESEITGTMETEGVHCARSLPDPAVPDGDGRRTTVVKSDWAGSAAGIP